MNYKRKITTAFATGAVVLNALAPAAFASDITISGNGAFSDNKVDVSNDNNTTVHQNNDAHVSNNVDSHASTGGNDASFNTGGDTTITTGNASTNTTVNNELNKNVASVSGGGNNGTDVTISGNGAFSDNKADVSNNSDVTVKQDNDAKVTNHIDSNATTGGNNANFNTGGDTTINTGNASTHTVVSTEANKNVAQVSGNNGSNDSNVQISGNGAFSDNNVDLRNGASTVVAQDNKAHVINHVKSNARTGGNDASFNTGGDTTINTGDAKTATDVRTAVNFNAADVKGDFAEAINVKVSGNGAESKNKVHAKSFNDHLVFQDNDADVFNKVDSDAKTGENAAKFNTAAAKGDPSIKTGNAEEISFVHTKSNENIAGKRADLKISDKLGVDFDFDLSGLFNALSFNK